MLTRRSVTIVIGVLLLAVSIYSLTIPSSAKSIICSSSDPQDCYSRDFKPSDQWQRVKEGQEVPPGLEFKIDLDTGLKEARLLQYQAADGKELTLDTASIQRAIEKTNSNQVVSYNQEEDIEDDADIRVLKMAVQGADTQIDVKDALEYIISNVDDEKVLVSSLDSLTEHSHNLRDGVFISEPESFNKLVEFATVGSKYPTIIKEMSSRVIAQSLRHNPAALSNVDADVVIPKFLKALQDEPNSVLQKRILGVLSSLVQTDDNSQIFKRNGGQTILLDSFGRFQDDSKVRCLEILDDIKKAKTLAKRSEDNDALKVFHTIQKSLSNNEIQDDHIFEQLFDRAVSLKQENKNLKSDPKFIEWLSEEIEHRKLAKRDSVSNDELHKKLLEARHVVFGNPNALRKAMADEL